MSVLVVDLGGTFLRTAVLSGDGTLQTIGRRRVGSVFEGREPADVWTEIVDAIAAAAHDAGASAGRIAVSFPGPMKGSTPIVAPTLTGAAPVPSDLALRIERRSGRPVRIVNDVAAAAAYVASNGADRSFFIVTVSSGIGSRVFHRGIEQTRAPFDGEIGHLVVDWSATAPACDCGGRGHLGAISSGRAFERLAREAAARNPADFAISACSRSGKTPNELTNEGELVPALRAGDAWTTALLRRSIAPLARLAFHVVVASGLERIYVFGGFAAALGCCYLGAFCDAIESQLDSDAIPVDPRSLVRVLPPDAEAALRGAALAA